MADLREGLRIFATQTVCRGIQQTTPPEYAEAVTGYFRQVGKVFCDMQTSGDFTHSGLLVAIEKIPSPLVTDTYALDAKLLLLSLYRVVYADRLRAEVPPDRWLSQASQAFCEAISDGLTDAGKTGIK